MEAVQFLREMFDLPDDQPAVLPADKAPVFGMDQLPRIRVANFVEEMAEHAAQLAVGPQQGAVSRQVGDADRYLLEGRTKACLALAQSGFRDLSRAAFFSFLQAARQHIAKTRQPVLQHIVGNAAFQPFDRGLLADSAGYQDHAAPRADARGWPRDCLQTPFRARCSRTARHPIVPSRVPRTGPKACQRAGIRPRFQAARSGA